MEPQNPTAPTNPTPIQSAPTPVVPSSTTPAAPAPKSHNMILILVLLVVILAAGGIGFMALRKNLTPPAPPVTKEVVIPPSIAPTAVASPSATPMPEIKSAADVTTEIDSLDASMSSTKSTDFDPNSLSDL